MIRKLNEADRIPLMALLHKDPALNLFIIGDVENFGFERDFMELWGRWMNRPGRIKAVMLRFYGSFLPYAEGSFDVERFAELVRKSGKTEMLSGSSHVLREFGQVPDCQGLATEVVARLCADVLMCWKRARRMNLQKAGVHRYRTWSMLYK
ncbi:hypothetical protein [Paenibacillus sp. FSL H8-0259]|uniref:hypothetical protein n=1 Tax=Paenibacillus sp. FSL H8-0259 TaxID=1920423 RepID=UPI00096BE1B0|nr:hypothetical protein [Paenibacillus sp. FSL H8-0259]OMF31040.1 hypothetical protein BK132_06325 [Paenibacillus sp. FSL H8-0259]